MKSQPFIVLITGLLIILWTYSALSKLLNIRKFKYALTTQVFPRWIAKTLLYLLPLVELCAVILLFSFNTRLIGMYSSLFMMLTFTLYVAGVVFKLYDDYPCSCGGLFGRLGWHKHFKVNIILTLIALSGVILMEM